MTAICNRNFQMHLLNENCFDFIQIPLEFVPKGAIGN